MKKVMLKVMGLMMIGALSSCAISIVPASSIEIKGDIKYIEYNIDVDYGNYIKDHATLLMDESLIFFDIKEYGIDKLIAGDYLKIAYKGDWIVRAIYPSTVDTSLIEIVDVSVTHGSIIEYKLTKNEDNEICLSLGNYDYIDINNFSSSNVILKNGNFVDLLSYQLGSTIYGATSAICDSIHIAAFYSYNPLESNLYV